MSRFVPPSLAALSLVALSLSGPLACFGHPQLRDGVYEDDTVRYTLEPPGEGWERLEMEQANLAWIHRELGASLLVNSHCEGVEDAPLEVLTRHLLMGMSDVEILSERRIELSRREALETQAEAKLDGVKRRLLLLVLKKDGCVYDLVLDASPESFARAAPAYERVRQSFDVLPRKGWS